MGVSRSLAVSAALLTLQAACTAANGPVGPTTPGGAGATPSVTGSPSPGLPSPGAASPTSGPVELGDHLHLELSDTGTFLVRGRYPRSPSPCVDPEQPKLLARYPGDLSIQRSDDGRISLTVTVPFDRYLEGIAEVPPSWPAAALEAQAIAARSYALATTGWSGQEGEELPTPICATTACQVYRGIRVPRDPDVRAWYRAVRRTDGQVLLYQGRPAETVYFSTSNGQTYGNEDVFGSSPLPYLRPVVERDDDASPLSRWSVRLPYGDLARFLGAAGEWARHRTIADIALERDTVTISGEGRTRSMDASTFRSAVNAWAPCLEPHRFPPPSWKGTPLPTTIPSRWMTLSTQPDAVIVEGRGWGHGVGMVQWGAYGKALRGMSASEILAHYYGGFLPQPHPEPGLIHVEVASGLRELRIVPSVPGATLEGEALGRDRVTVSGGDALTVTVERR